MAKMTAYVTSATAAQIRELGPTSSFPVRSAFAVDLQRRVVLLASPRTEEDA